MQWIHYSEKEMILNSHAVNYVHQVIIILGSFASAFKNVRSIPLKEGTVSRSPTSRL